MGSNINPPLVSHPIGTFANLVRQDIENLRSHHKGLSVRHPNLMIAEREALKILMDNPRITIKLAEKGGGDVIMDTATL